RHPQLLRPTGKRRSGDLAGGLARKLSFGQEDQDGLRHRPRRLRGRNPGALIARTFVPRIITAPPGPKRGRSGGGLVLFKTLHFLPQFPVAALGENEEEKGGHKDSRDD